MVRRGAGPIKRSTEPARKPPRPPRDLARGAAKDVAKGAGKDAARIVTKIVAKDVAKAGPALRPGPEGGRRDQNRKEKVRGLEEAALRLFLERGLDGVTIDDITQACGVAKGTFYRYFDDKDALVESLLAPVREELVAALELCGRSLAAARDVAAMYEAYRALSGTFFGVILKHAGMVRLYLQESRGPAVGARTRIVALSRLLSGYALSITAKAHNHGLLRPVRAEVSALAVVGAVERLLYAVLSEEEIGNPLEAPELLVGIILDGLRKK